MERPGDAHLMSGNFMFFDKMMVKSCPLYYLDYHDNRIGLSIRLSCFKLFPRSEKKSDKLRVDG